MWDGQRAGVEFGRGGGARWNENCSDQPSSITAWRVRTDFRTRQRAHKLGPFEAQKIIKNHGKNTNIRARALPRVLVLPSTEVLASIVLASIFNPSIPEYPHLLGTRGHL